MQAGSALYDSLLRNPNHSKEAKVSVSGVDYGHSKIESLRTYGGIFSEPDIGTCASRQIDLVITEPGDIPKGAEIRLFARLRAEDSVSEWIPKGVFYISTRKTNKITGALEIHGFDAMRRAMALWEIDPLDNWPMTQTAAVNSIVQQMGIFLDSRTVLQSGFPVGYPVDENGDLDMIDILEGIAVCNAGNWIITDEGKLLLLRFGDIPPETNYLVTEYGDAITFGGVKILVR